MDGDWIEIVDQEIYCRIGVPEVERLKPQRLLVSTRFQIGQRFGELEDRLDMTINYSAVAAEVIAIATEKETLLVETLADKISNRLMERFPMRRVRVSVKKFVLANTKYVEVTMERAE
jgi:dihydroneopterin aldolase